MRCEDIASHPDFRHLSTLRGVAVDLRYASLDNFVGRNAAREVFPWVLAELERGDAARPALQT